MSGFTGFIGETKNASVVLERMMDNIKHRGPDTSYMFIENEAALGFCYLSNIDLEYESQPYYTEDEYFVLSFNGQIYNSKELREKLISTGSVFKTSTHSEVLIRGYEKYGESFTTKLRGMFAFVIWDRKNKKLFGARDILVLNHFNMRI